MQRQLGPDHILINVLKIFKFAALLIADGKEFHILGPRLLNEFVPYFLVLWWSTINLFSETSLLVFNLKISFINIGFISFRVLKISIARFLSFLTSMVGLFALTRRCS